MSQLKSQFFGLMLAITTAIGCIAYEKIVKNFSFGIILLLSMCFYIPTFIAFYFFNKTDIHNDISRLISDKHYILWSCLYVSTWLTAPLWYIITKKQGVVAGSIYEVKYIVIMSIFYIMFGNDKLTTNTIIGILLALISIYFISK